jgi:hypothetical protein
VQARYLLQRHPLPMSCRFDHCLVITWALPAPVLQPLVPAFRPAWLTLCAAGTILWIYLNPHRPALARARCSGDAAGLAGCGKVTLTLRPPPGSGRAMMAALCAVAMAWTMDSPSPCPSL